MASQLFESGSAQKKIAEQNDAPGYPKFKKSTSLLQIHQFLS